MWIGMQACAKTALRMGYSKDRYLATIRRSYEDYRRRDAIQSDTWDERMKLAERAWDEVSA